ncbi:trafficking protein particle complex subunit 10, partial [Phellopilus nigrolimitatus]
MQAQRVKITLAAPPQLNSTDQWAQIWSGFAAQFPLRNLHWKPASRTSIRTIQTLEVNVLTLESVKEEGASQIPLSLLDRPFLNVYVVVCDDNDTYKNTVKKQIKDWHSQVTQRKSQEWLIMVVTKSDSRQSQTGLLKMRGTVLDRVRADFNVDKKDRCAQLTWTTDFKNPTAWAEIISKVKDGIISAFDQAVSQREEEVKRSELQKKMPGWNFCTFFLLKESLASSFEGANLPEDALLQYEELEASFFQVLKDRTLWFGNFIEPSPKDDSLPLLLITKKPYRDLILANTISVFDIRVYLLARQSNLLGQMRRVTDIAKKATMFLATFGSRLQEFQSSLPNFFVESWVYSSALSTVETCDEWTSGREMAQSSLSGFNAAKGELLTSARNQLDKLGIQLGYLPNKPPFSACAVDLDESEIPKSSDATSNRKITNADILGFLENKPSFYDLYIRLTNKAIDLFVKAGRRKFALKLHGSLAALDVYRERYSNAFQTYTSLPAHYAPHRWSSLESYMLFQSIETHARMQNVRDRQWIHTAMTFIKAYVEDNTLELLSGVKDKDVYIASLIKSVIDAASQIDTDLQFQEQPMISIIPLHDSGRCADSQDGYFLDVNVKNHLPCDLSIDKIMLALSGRSSEVMEFESSTTKVGPGDSTVTLFCPIPTAGSFLVEKAEVRLGRLILQWSFNSKQKRRQSSTMTDKVSHMLVKLPSDPRVVRVQVEQPLNVEVAGPSKLAVILSCGRNMLSRALMKFSSSDITIKTKEGVAEGEYYELVSFSSDAVIVVNTMAGQVIRFDISHSSASSRDLIKVLVDLEYVTVNEPDIVRKMCLSRVVPTALALAVSVQDFFRGETLLTKFTVSTTTHQHIRISSVGLQPGDKENSSIKIVEHSSPLGTITVTPAQPASFTFQVKMQGEVNDPLRLRITYRLLREEVEALVSHQIGEVLPDPSEWKERNAIQELIIHALEGDSSWVELYEITGEVHVPDTDFKAIGVSDELFVRIRQSLRENVLSTENVCDWRRFSIPVDLPRLDILATARIDIAANPFDTKPTNKRHSLPIYAGQPITAILSINTSFYWAGRDKKDITQYRMRFELEETIKDWLVSGQRRGDFIAKNDSTHIVSITLMALRHGEIPLPKVLVTAFPPLNGGSSITPPSLETYQVHGAERLLVLPRAGRTTFFLNVGRE